METENIHETNAKVGSNEPTVKDKDQKVTTTEDQSNEVEPEMEASDKVTPNQIDNEDTDIVNEDLESLAESKVEGASNHQEELSSTEVSDSKTSSKIDLQKSEVDTKMSSSSENPSDETDTTETTVLKEKSDSITDDSNEESIISAESSTVGADWASIDNNGNIIQNDCANFQGRIIGKCKSTNYEAAYHPFVVRFDLLVKKYEKLKASVTASENKADILPMITNMIEYLPQVDAIGDFDSLILNLQIIENDINEVIDENIKLKENLCEIAESISTSTDWDATEKEYLQLLTKWKTISHIPMDIAEDLWRRFHRAEQLFNKQHQQFLSKHRAENLKEKEELCHQAEILSESNDWRGTADEFRILQKKFSKIGAVSRDYTKAINLRFQNAYNKFIDRRNTFFNDQDIERRHNLNIKEKLCEIAESLCNSTDWDVTSEKLINLQEDWKKIGPVPREQADEVWQKFQKCMDHFFTRRREYYKMRNDEQKANLVKKEKLIEKAEALKESTDWQETGAKLIELQQQWKSIGPVPRDIADSVWDHFRSINDHFFTRRKEYYNKLNQEKRANLNKKNELIAIAESLLDADDLMAAGSKMKKLQKQWRSIGPVPRNKSNIIWDKFNKINDKFFAKRNENLKGVWQENLTKKEQLCELAEKYKTATDWNETSENFKKLQQEWKKTGPVHPSKSDEIWSKFRNAADYFFDQRNQHYNEENPDWQDNVKQKEKLCKAAESINSIDDWKEANTKVNQLRAEWKEVGFIPKDISDGLWYRFKRSLDIFYKSRQKFFKEKDSERSENLKRKEEFCDIIEKLDPINNWKESDKIVIKLKEDWNNVGPVPRNKSDAVWNRFRNAIDNYFSHRNDYYQKNLLEKKTVCKNIESLKITEDDQAAIEKVKEYQQQWKQIGPVPRNNMDQIYTRYKKACDKVFEFAKLKRAGNTDEWKLKLYEKFLT